MSKNNFYKIGFSLIIALMLNVKLWAVDQITFTWRNDDLSLSVDKRVKIQATEGETFTVNWGDNSQIVLETGAGNSDITLCHFYVSTDEYTVTIIASDTACKFTSFDCSGYYNDLNVVSNQISNLNLTDCSLLQSLYCRYNLLTDLDLSGCSILHTLDCSSNSLTVLEITSGSALRQLNCNANKIQNLDLAIFPYLQSLSCRGNLLSNLDLTICSDLKELFCDNNLLTSLDLSGCPDLQSLFCVGNLLSVLDLTNAVALINVFCGNNQLTMLNLTNCLMLQIFNCDNNLLTALEFTNSPNLYRLDCNNNKINDLNLTGCPALGSLSCGYNKLTELDLSGYTNLYVLHCYNNLLTDINVSNCPALQVIWCMSNQLTNININGCSVLHNLFCYDNQLTNLDFSGCLEFNWLDCSNNLLTGLDLRGYTTLRTLNCQNNKLTTLNLTDCLYCGELYCYNNHLQLSDLYTGHLLNSYSYYKKLGTQNLQSQTVKKNEIVDFSEQSIFGGFTTSFIIEKDGNPANINVDYSINNGKITFYNLGIYTVIMTNNAIVSHEDYPAKVMVDITVTDITAIPEIPASIIKTYPNPAIDIIFVECDNINTIKLYDMLSKEILTQTVNGIATINVSHLPNGIYFIQVISDGIVIGMNKIVKSR